jgi:VTC domain
LERLLGGFSAIGLDELDARAALQRRVDTKYLVSIDELADLLADLRADHQALEIDGRRSFSYESVYFDTGDLRCFRDHVADRVPRFKVRSRLYVNSAECYLEAKVKRNDQETDKEQVEIDPEERGRVEPARAEFLRGALDCVAEPPSPDELEPALITRFARCTLAAADGSERVTCDGSLEVRRANGGSARLRSECIIVETKTEDGEGRCDRLLERAGIRSVSLSKYRVGVGLLLAEDPDPQLGERRGELFETRA